ncbi:MAG TPA: Gldg family protein, partial [Thermodesulfobacteriota bacterium]|nr:Gldg family protein [Thermodesulfobacteriota bacterium]
MKQYVSYLGLLGLVLLAVGGVIYAVQWEMSTPVAALIWAGVLLSILFLYVNFPEMKRVFSGRSVKYGANAAVMAAVFIGILVIVALMSIKYKTRVDLTSTNRYTLSAQTRKILKGLKKNIEVISFYRSDERTRQAMEDLLQSYSSVTPRFTYWFV